MSFTAVVIVLEHWLVLASADRCETTSLALFNQETKSNLLVVSDCYLALSCIAHRLQTSLSPCVIDLCTMHVSNTVVSIRSTNFDYHVR